MLHRMEAEIVTDDPDPMVTKLTELGFEIEVIVWPDDDGSTIVATKLTELDDEFAFYYAVDAIVDPLGGLMGAGLVWKPSLVREPGLVKRRYVTRY
jgi:hypothetical protein